MESHNIDYDALVDTTEVKDITSNKFHQYVLRQIKNDVPDRTHLYLFDEDAEDADENSYCPENLLELGWLGYFIGNNTHLKCLNLEGGPLMSSAGAWEVFCRGMIRNKSIDEIYFYDLSQMEINRMLGAVAPMFGTSKINHLSFTGCHYLGAEECRQLSSVIGGIKEDCYIDGSHLVDVISALSLHPELEHLELGLAGNILGINSCLALEGLLHFTTTLQSLDLGHSGIDDDSVTILSLCLSHSKSLRSLWLNDSNMGDAGIYALVSALKGSKLEILNLSSCPLVTGNGWKSISTLLECPNSNLEKLYVDRNAAIGDEEAALFASALACNSTLKELNILNYRRTDSITAKGLAAFSRLLCDTSDVNATYHSNHTLVSMMGHQMDDSQREMCVEILSIDLNERYSKQEIAIIKILKSHSDINMQSMFKWDLKVLPLVLAWFERAATCPTIVEADIDKRKASALYGYVRGAPIVAIEGLLWHDLFTIGDGKSELLWGSSEVNETFVSQTQELDRAKGKPCCGEAWVTSWTGLV